MLTRSPVRERRRMEAITLVTLQCLLVQNYGSLHMNSCSCSPDFNPLLYLKMSNLLSIYLVHQRYIFSKHFPILTKYILY